MNNKLMVFLLVISLFASAAFAQNAANQFTGNDYLSTSKQNRIQSVTSLISDARQGGVTIKQSPVSYCMKLDSFYGKHPDMKNQPLAVVLKTLIVMEYDWSQKGVDKEQLAKEWLGDKIYQENKTRLIKR